MDHALAVAGQQAPVRDGRPVQSVPLVRMSGKVLLRRLLDRGLCCIGARRFRGLSHELLHLRGQVPHLHVRVVGEAGHDLRRLRAAAHAVDACAVRHLPKMQHRRPGLDPRPPSLILVHILVALRVGVVGLVLAVFPLWGFVGFGDGGNAHKRDAVRFRVFRLRPGHHEHGVRPVHPRVPEVVPQNIHTQTRPFQTERMQAVVRAGVELHLHPFLPPSLLLIHTRLPYLQPGLQFVHVYLLHLIPLLIRRRILLSSLCLCSFLLC
mmetsp:Transcript_27980/g.46918  ORF Transcript_27980/g.46918 Transcript_27980/m.46918 type:complete len:265 (+) Transcript_27980:965-1759(+)